MPSFHFAAETKWIFTTFSKDFHLYVNLKVIFECDLLLWRYLWNENIVIWNLNENKWFERSYKIVKQRNGEDIMKTIFEQDTQFNEWLMSINYATDVTFPGKIALSTSTRTFFYRNVWLNYRQYLKQSSFSVKKPTTTKPFSPYQIPF